MPYGKARWFLKILALALAMSALAALPAWADATLDFQLAGAGGGAFNFAGGTNPLVASGIPIRIVSANGTPLNNGATLSITNGALSFTTGNLLSYVGGVMTFGGGGSFNIFGTIPSIGITTTSVPLISGSFQGATFAVNSGRTSVFLGTGADVKHPTLVSYFFNTPPDAWIFSPLIAAGVPTLLANNAFKNAVKPTSVDIVNTAVPEVGSILMLGTSLLATAYLVRRRARKQV